MSTTDTAGSGGARPTGAASPTELRKTISPLALIAIGAAGVIGSSWLYLGSEFFASFGAGGTILGFIVATLLAATIALSYSELAKAMPRAGGEIVYAYVAAGRLPAFVVGWFLIGSYAGIVAFYVTATGRLLSAVWPQLNTIPLYEIGGETIFLPILAIGFALTLVILALNWSGAGLSSRTELILFAIMCVIAVIVCVTAFANGSPDNLWPMFDSAVHGDTSPVLLTLMFVLPAFSFLTGFGIVAIMAEEAEASPKQIGRIVVLSVLLAGGFYAIVLIATAWLLPWQEIAGMTNGTIEAFQVAGFEAISMGAFAIGALGIITTFIAVFAAASRLMFALSRIELLPPWFGALDERTRTPRNALLFTAAVGLVLGSLGPGALVWFLNTGGVYIGIVWAFTVYALWAVRRRYPAMREKSSGALLWLSGLGALAALGVVAAALVPGTALSLRWPYEYLIIIAWVVLGTVLYFLSPRRMTRDTALDALLGSHRADLGEEADAGSRAEPSPSDR